MLQHATAITRQDWKTIKPWAELRPIQDQSYDSLQAHVTMSAKV
jgi:hypothetical protein